MREFFLCFSDFSSQGEDEGGQRSAPRGTAAAAEALLPWRAQRHLRAGSEPGEPVVVPLLCSPPPLCPAPHPPPQSHCAAALGGAGSVVAPAEAVLPRVRSGMWCSKHPACTRPQAKGIAPSQAQEKSTLYRPVAPGTLAQDERPVVPQGETGREYTIAYYKRDTRRGVDWNYADAEGKLAPTTPFKYMDGTPFLKQYKLREELPSQMPKVDTGASSPCGTAGMPPTAGRIPQYQVRAACKQGPANHTHATLTANPCAPLKANPCTWH